MLEGGGKAPERRARAVAEEIWGGRCRLKRFKGSVSASFDKPGPRRGILQQLK